MICPNCNLELPEGHLYCEKCGTEIQMVPVFEPEVEESISKTLSDIAEIIEPVQQKEERTKDKIVKRRPRLRMYYFIPIGFFVVIAMIFITVYVSRQYSYSFQYHEALDHYNNKEYETAISYAKRAIKLDGSAKDAAVLLADLYVQAEKYDEAIAVMLPLLDVEQADKDIYEEIVMIYEKQGNYEAINQLISACKDVQIVAMFEEYTAVPPEFSLEEGIYYKSEKLKLLVSSKGTIYYTMDGQEPTLSSTLYNEEIVLEEGTNIITAIFVNEWGVMSTSAKRTYTVELKMPKMPIIKPESGNYTIPEAITVDAENSQDAIIYYTDDGSQPTVSSNEYITSIPMPLNNSTFYFMAVSREGICSEVVKREYNLQITSLVDINAAEQAVIITLYGKGELLDLTGKPKDGDGINSYKCNAAAKAGSRVYYIVEEFKEKDSLQESTGRYFGVDVRTGELYNVTINQETGLYEFSLFSLMF